MTQAYNTVEQIEQFRLKGLTYMTEWLFSPTPQRFSKAVKHLMQQCVYMRIVEYCLKKRWCNKCVRSIRVLGHAHSGSTGHHLREDYRLNV